MRPPVKFHWRGNHHIYYGIFFLLFGVFNEYMSWGNGNLAAPLMPLWTVITVSGFAMIVDDVIEHTWTADTPLRILYRFMFKVEE